MNAIQMIPPKEAIIRLGVSYSTLLRYVKAKTIPFVKVGNKLLFPVSFFNELEKLAYDNLNREVI